MRWRMDKTPCSAVTVKNKYVAYMYPGSSTKAFPVNRNINHNCLQLENFEMLL